MDFFFTGVFSPHALADFMEAFGFIELMFY